MAWLSYNGVAFTAKRHLPITSVTPAAQVYTTNVVASHDTYIQSTNDLNFGNATTTALNGIATNICRVIQRYTCTPPVVGATLTSALLYMYYDSWAVTDPVNLEVTFYKMQNTPGTSWVEGAGGAAGASWNHYELTGALNWTGGHDGAWGDCYDGADPAHIHATIPAAAGYLKQGANAYVDVTTMVQDAIDHSSNVVNILLKYSDENDAHNHVAYFRSSEHATTTTRPTIVCTWSYTPSVPSNYKFPVTVHKGNPSVAACTETVNSKVYHWYLPFTITAMSATGVGYSGVNVAIDTAKLLADVGGTGGASRFFAGSTVTYAPTVEFVQVNGADVTSNTCKYCFETALGAIEDWNTDHTPYILRIPLAMTSGTEYTFRMYFDAYRDAGDTVANDTASTNYLYGAPDTATGTWNYFRDFATSYGTLADFLAGQTEWEVLKDAAQADPLVNTTTASVITLTGGVGNTKFSGIRVKSASFNATDFKIRIRFTENPGNPAWSGMCGGTGPEKSGAFITGQTNEVIFYYNNDGTYSARDLPYPTSGAWVAELRKIDTTYRYVYYRHQSTGYPDYWTQSTSDWIINTTADDVAHMPYIGSYGTTHQHIDYIAVGDFVAYEPIVFVPNVTYDEPGVIFCKDICVNWPYDLAFTGTDGETEIYWWQDVASQKSKHPGDTLEITLRSLALDNMCMYFGHSALDADNPNPYCDALHTFEGVAHDEGLWESYDTFDDYTAVVGTWVGGDNANGVVAEPVFTYGDAGNVPLGGGGGRTWDRMPNVVKWDTDKYIKVSNGSAWEASGTYWPCPFNIQIAYSTAVDGVFSGGKVAFDDPNGSGEGWGLIMLRAVVQGVGAAKKLYVFYQAEGGGGYFVASTSDPYADPIVWTLNTTKLMDTAWLQATGHWGVTDTIGFLQPTFTWDGTKWRIIYYAMVGGGSVGTFGYCYTTASPDNWNNSSFTDVGPLLTPGEYTEDHCLIYNEVDTWYLFAHIPSPAANVYWDSTDFTNWGVKHTASIGVGPWATYTVGARFIYENSLFYVHYSGSNAPVAESYLAKWVPNLIGCSSSATLNGTFAVCNTHKKAYVSNTTGFNLAFDDTFECPADFEYVSEVIMKVGGGETSTGLLFRYDEDLDTGYAAFLNYVSGVPTLTCYKVVANALVAFSPAQSYTIPIFPLPRFYPGYSWRMVVQCYGPTIKVGYSPWGNAIVWGLSFNDELYRGDRIGPCARIAASYFDRARVRRLVKDASWLEPAVGLTETLYDIEVADGLLSGDTLSTWKLTLPSSLDGFTPGDSVSIGSVFVPVSLSDGLKAGDGPVGSPVWSQVIADGLNMGEGPAQVIGEGLQENYTTGDDGARTMYGVIWAAQSFTPTTAHTITSVQLLLYRANSPGTLTVSIRATDGSGKPTGADLCSGTTDGNTLPTGSPYEWREITLGAGYSLAAGTKYAIVARVVSGTATNWVGWRRKTVGAYAGGNYITSSDSGATWTVDATRDFMFKEYGATAWSGPEIGLGYYPAITDGLKSGDDGVVGLGYYPSITDGLKGTETLETGLGFQSLATDGLIGVDTPVGYTGIPTSLTDGVTVTDTDSMHLTIPTAATDGLIVSDVASLINDLYDSITEGIKLSDSPTNFMTAVVAITDGVTASDALTAVMGYCPTASDGVKFGETLIPVGTSDVSISDGFKMSEMGGYFNIFMDTAEDGLKISDDLSGITTFDAAIMDGVVGSDVVSVGAVWDSTVTEGLKMSDANAVIVAFNPAVTDGVKLSELLDAFKQTYPSLSDDIILADSPDIIRNFFPVLTEGVTISDAPIIYITVSRTITDGLTASDVISDVMVQWMPVIMEGIKLSDSSSGYVWTPDYYVESISGLVFGDVASVVITFHPVTTDGFKIGDTSTGGRTQIPGIVLYVESSVRYDLVNESETMKELVSESGITSEMLIEQELYGGY